MRRDIYQEYVTWTPVDANDKDWYSRPVPDDMILSLHELAIYQPTISANLYLILGIDSHGQFIPAYTGIIQTAYKGGSISFYAGPILLYEHQRIQLKWVTVESAENHYFGIHGILYDADEWRKGFD